MRTRLRQRPIIRGRDGFTFIEVAVATALVGLAIASLMLLFGSGTRSITQSTDTSTGLTYARNIMEMCEGKTRAQLVALHGTTDAAMVDAAGQAVANATGWTYSVSVAYVSPANVAGTSSAVATDLARVTVTIKMKGQRVSSLMRLIAFTED